MAYKPKVVVLRERAKTIATAICETDVSDRGTLMRFVSEILQQESQHFTAKHITAASVAYGEPADHKDMHYKAPRK